MKDWEEIRGKGREGTCQCPGTSSCLGVNYASSSEDATAEDLPVKSAEGQLLKTNSSLPRKQVEQSQ